jgi:ribose/xylose/arabinose/galactoside ABC-type transport system permease subunit
MATETASPVWRQTLRLSVLQEEGAIVALLLLVVACTIISPNFLTHRNLYDLADQIPIYAMLAAAQMLVIISGGIDLSVGSLVVVGAFFAATQSFNGTPQAIVVALVVTGLLGAVNGLAIAFTRVPPFIVTLGMLSVARGLALEATSIYHGQSVAAGGAQPVSSIEHGSFIFLSQGTLWGIPFPAYLAVAVFLALAYTLRFTQFGRHVFALGGNEAAAELLGVRAARVKIAIYTFSGLLSGFAGVLLASRLSSAPPTEGLGWELDSITAVVIGGTLLTGGVGTVRGTLAGLLFINILPNIFNLTGVDPSWQLVVRGGVLLAVVIFQVRIVPSTRIGGLPLRTEPTRSGP